MTTGTVRASGDGWGVGLYSDDDEYRFWFATEVDPARRAAASAQHLGSVVPPVDAQTLVWVGLNPSRSDDNGANRATLRTVLGWADRAGLDRVLGVNLYAWRHTDSAQIRLAHQEGRLADLIGDQNAEVLHHAATADHVLLAWGSHGALADRGSEVARLFPQGMCVGTCGNGQPFHPARKPTSLRFQPYPPR